MNKFYFFILLLWGLVVTQMFAQDNPEYLKGRILDTANEAVIGANIKWEGTSVGTITDVDGNFVIPRIKETNVLSVSFIGFQSQQIKIEKTKKEITIVIKDDAQQLDEIVVVGYGTQKKSSLTSSIEVVRNDELLQMPTINIDEALSGQVAGMQVMSTTGDPSSAKESDISIRGINGSPLLVIDGVPRFGTNSSEGEMRLSDLNPDDIESISILKDAAAAAVYGARAANGVILVQTKRAQGNKKVSVNYRGQFNLQQATELPEFLDAYEFAKLYNQAVDNSPGVDYKKYDDAQLEMIKNHSNPNVYGDENLLDYLDKFGYSTIHSLSLSGGNNFVKYYISGGYTNTKGLYSGVGRDRFNYSVKLDANLAKGLTLSVDLTGANSSNKNTSYTTINAAYNFSPLQTLRFTDGSLASINGSNPLVAVEGLGGYIKNKSNMNTINATLRYELPWVKGLSVYARATFDKNNSIQKTFSSPTDLYLYDEKTGEISVDPLTTYPKAKITLEEMDRFVDNKLFEVGINYSHTFAGKHDVSGLLVANYQDYNNRYLTGMNEDMPGIYPEIIGAAASSKLNGSEYFNQRASLIGRVTYGYGNRYFIEGSFRVDGSTKFHPDNRWGFFPTVSGSWVLSNEDFFKNWSQPVISNVKFRGSMGVLGNDGLVDDFSYLMNYMYSLNSGYNIGGSYKPGIIMATGSYPNPDLTWGKSKDFNIATDLGFWDNRFGISYEYFWRYNTNMITAAPMYLYPPSTGVEGNLPNVNFGKIKAWGWDLTFTHKNSINKFKYDVSVILSKYNDVVLDYGDESSIEPSRRRVGTSSMVWWLYEDAGLFQSWEEIQNYHVDQDGQGNATLAPGDIKYVDQNSDNMITDIDKIAVRNSSNPLMSMSFKLGMRYKGFFINAMFQGVTDYQQQVTELYTLENSSLQRFQTYHRDNSWTEANPNAEYPRIKFATKNDNNRLESTFWVRNCDFIRLKSLSLGYAIPSHILKKAKIASATISLQGSNLFTWSTLDNMDPESLRGYPIQRSYGVTLNLGF